MSLLGNMSYSTFGRTLENKLESQETFPDIYFSLRSPGQMLNQFICLREGQRKVLRLPRGDFSGTFVIIDFAPEI